MPKSKHRRKGRNRTPQGNRDSGPVFTYRGRRYRGVRRLPAEYHPDRLDEEHGDDAFMWCCELVRGALGDNADGVLADVTMTTPDRLIPLLRQIADAYRIQIALDKLHSDTRHDADAP